MCARWLAGHLMKADACVQVYGLPFGMTKRYEAAVGPYKARIHKFFQAFKLWGRSSGEGRV